jgi:predicted metal-dependent enzyme (double-stranded beta helix superfamily)
MDTALRIPPAAPAAVSGKLAPAALGRLVTATAAAEQLWRPLVRFTPGQRWFHRLALTTDYEIWLLSWLPGQHTGFHDHGDASGAFTVASGELRETLAAPGSSRVRRRTAAQGSVTRFGGQHLHDVGNVTPAPVISVHAYSPPLSAMRRYQMTNSGLALLRTDRAELDW